VRRYFIRKLLPFLRAYLIFIVDFTTNFKLIEGV